jgi:hypothetical protein
MGKPKKKPRDDAQERDAVQEREMAEEDDK